MQTALANGNSAANYAQSARERLKLAQKSCQGVHEKIIATNARIQFSRDLMRYLDQEL
jgi:hypothetical protein